MTSGILFRSSNRSADNLRRNNDTGAPSFTRTVIAMTYGGIKIDGVSLFQTDLLGADGKFQFAGDQIKQFDTRMLVKPRPVGRNGFEFGVESIQLALGCLEVQAFEVICDAASPGIFRKPQAFSLARDRHHMTLAFVGEEIF